MKIVSKTEMVEKSVNKYEAFDGKLFDYYSDCEEYEQEKLEEKLVAIEQCEELEGYAPFGCGESNDNHGYKWFRPKNEEEIAILQEVYGEDARIWESDIGKWICVEISDGDAWSYDLHDMIDYARKVLDKLGFDMTVTKRGEENARQE